ncbi:MULTISPECIES: sensor histidine kinase [Rhodococcus]|uniref:sensor histidine kinase n=1 Tax=Rhodococcus TaxID=1827 RepID=UPI0002E52A30|nr:MULTISPECIES: ATP-binding protein [Rhodococcus]MBP2214173.1 signal transduction histidine kinase [Rhodococcus ruber]MCF8784764.1 HAMP domain-containing protein [Rhodococcus ruber]MCZ1073794.1 ATP-binding protein [Rhodococcus sp. A5(2022)]MDO2379400.1 ATP-binding protein [Rhodococcus ruber]
MSDESPPRQRWWNIEGWGLRWKVTAVLAVPVTVAMVLGGLRVQQELSNAVHFSSAADQVAVVPDLVDFGTAFGTASATLAAGTGVTNEIENLDATLERVRAVSRNPELDPVIAADLTRTVAAAESLRDRIAAGDIPLPELNEQTNTIRKDLIRIVEAIVEPIEDPSVLAEGTRLVDAWASQRYLFDQVMGIVAILRDPDQPGTTLVSASGSELAMLETLARSYPASDAQIQELRSGVAERTAMIDAAGAGPLPILNLRASLLESVEVYGTLIDEASDAISSTVLTRASDTRSAALRDTAIVLGALLAALVLALLVSRSLVGPIRRLRYGALKVARQELPDAIDRIKVGDNVEDIEFTRVPVHTTEEIGQLARAVDDMHGQALRLAGEQAHLRLQINDMFETLARRSKSLVEQQLGLIERLEYEEKDPARLESLFRLDHLAARMRRNGDNLLILSGTRMRRGHSAPVQLGDILRAAMSEVEDYQRVQIGSTPEGALSGTVATDIVHLLAELVDNSLRASPPDSTVTFSFARAVDGGLLVEIADRGIGIPAEELDAINERLALGGEVGPDTARHMGLFVVSRLAARHGLTVRLRPTFDTARNPGITASVHIPDVLLVSPLALSQTGPQPRTGEDGRPAETLAPRPPRDVTVPAAPERAPAPASALPHREPASALPQREPASALPQREPGSGLPQRQAAPVAAESAAGLPQRQPGATPGLPQRRPGSTPGLPQRQPGAAPERQPTPLADLPRRQPGPTPVLPSRRTETVSSAPAPAPAAPRSPGSGLPQRRPGATPGISPQPAAAPNNGAPGNGLPQRRPGSTPGLPIPPAASESALAQRNSEPSATRDEAADGQPGRASRHRYRTNPAKTASFFQPRPDVDTLRPHPGAGTPIFADMMSSWLVDPTSQPEDRRPEWNSRADAGWRAAQEAAQAPVEQLTTAGLPRRAPGHRLVPGAVASPATGSVPAVRRRDPEAIRANLSRHQQGVRNGRASAHASTQTDEQGVR